MTKGRVAGSSLSYPVCSEDLFGGHYAVSLHYVSTEPKSRIQLERLHKTTIKTEMNKDRKKKQKKNTHTHNDYFIVRVLLT